MNISTFFVMILFIATGLMLFIAYLSFRKRHLAIAKYTSFVMLASSFYSFGYAFELLSTDLHSVKFWLKVEYIGSPFISTFWLIFILHFTGYQHLLKKWVIALLFVIPTLTLIFHYTNDWHHFYYRNLQLADNPLQLSKTMLEKGPWYWIQVIYNHLLGASGVVFFARMYVKAKPIVKKQIIMMMLGTLSPWFANFIYLFLGDNWKIDLTPIGFTLTGIFLVWAIYRFNLNRLVPVAIQTVFETMQDGVLILDYEDNVTSMNRAAKHIFDQLLPATNHNDSIYHILSNYPDVLLKLHSPISRISLKKGQENRYYDMKVSPIYEKESIELGKLITINDVTQVTLYQEELLTNANQLAELGEFKDNLFTVIAHDIRDPLAILINLLDLLEEELQNYDIEEVTAFHEMNWRLRNTYKLVEQLLDWYRSQQGKLIFRPVVWNLSSVINQTIESIKIKSKQKNIHIRSSVAENVQVYADIEMVKLIIRTLLSNAIKFSEINGEIELGAVIEGSQVKVFVKDFGVGVDREIAKTLFRKVQQMSITGTEGEEGTGLGLYLAGKFVEMNGGTIWFESNIGEGSTFFFSLPSSKDVGN
ncbi:ATP-binding protein [Caldibacillus lycopersici]|uniref:histidine kinase n=1 Tax=Perspicuibacillus lycopersici TaxID=1325689 RepID=A0AAE3IS28_9BACI|nr:histidine kinase N-terminal 7TM domain-containing protein [Perspicuibacillus lycopersici]MCU9613441.1 ATP-binding protein [Perspicuibacillus lycopersici]